MTKTPKLPSIAIVMGEATDYYQEVRDLPEEIISTKNKHVVPKQYIDAIFQNGGMPFCIDYNDYWLSTVPNTFDGVMFIGSTTRYPKEWYIDQKPSTFPQTEKRVEFETKLMKLCLNQKIPVLGICGGMQTLAGVSGYKMTSNIENYDTSRQSHSLGSNTHEVTIEVNTKLGHAFKAANDNTQSTSDYTTIDVNSYHSEAIVTVPQNVIISAYANDGTIEAIEIKDHPYAVGTQFHPELMVDQKPDHTVNVIFQSFIQHCSPNC